LKITFKLFCFIILTAAVFTLVFCTTGTSSAKQEQKEKPEEQEESIVKIIQGLAANIERRLPENTRMAVVNVSSESAVFSDYVIEELISAFMDSGKLMIVDRNALHLAMVRSEMNFQLSGDVSDETQQSIGKMLGAQSILSASLIDMGDAYRLRAAVIRVETLAREATVANDVQKSRRVEFLMKTNEPVTRKRIDKPVTAFDFRRRGNEYLYDQRDPDQAIADFTEAIKLNPRDPDSYVFRADAWYWKNDYRRAIEDYTEALRLVPGYTLAYLNRGQVYIEIKDYNRADEDLNRVLRMDQNNADAHHAIGTMRYQMGNYQGALEAFNQCIRLSKSENWDFYKSRSEAYARLGDWTRAIADLEKTYQLNPDDKMTKDRIESQRNPGIKIWVW
jgi:tetratricopeptide (TPR) repeat protein